MNLDQSMKRVVPTVVVVDTSDGFVYWRGMGGALFTLTSAQEWAEFRNAEYQTDRFEVRLLTVVP